MEVWKIMFLSKWVICRFQPLIFRGVVNQLCFLALMAYLIFFEVNPFSWEGFSSFEVASRHYRKAIDELDAQVFCHHSVGR